MNLKILKDRLNTLKSELSQEKMIKLTKVLNIYKIEELEVRINEVQLLIKKFEKL